MAKKKKRKIAKYRRPLNFNIGMIIFMLIFFYLIFSVYTYMGREKIQFYEVVEGGIVNDDSYTGIALRQETVNTVEKAGNINFYVMEQRRVSVGTRVYSIDETGSMAAYREQNPEAETKLSDKNIGDLKKQMTSFSLSFSDQSFSRVYDMKIALNNAVTGYVSFNSSGNAESIMEQMGINFHQVKAEQAGIVSYATDGLETMNAGQISEELFKKENYPKVITKPGDLVGVGSPAYKVVTSERWSLVFPMTEDDVSRYGQQTSLSVLFGSDGLTATGDFSVLTGTDQKTYGKIDLNKYMIEFVSERYIDFKIISDKVSGLKIPKSAVTEKTFFLVPVEYLTMGGDSSEQGFLKEVYSEGGTSTVFVPTSLYFSTVDSYYIEMGDKSEIKAGDYIVKPDSAERYQVGTSGTLKGVYNINKGYSVFRQIEILAENEEFYTVKKGTKYGLSVFDHIMLDASLVGEGELIYQ